jgi:hypothetical protein
MKKNHPRLKLSSLTIRRLQDAELGVVGGGISTTPQSTDCSTTCNQIPEYCSVQCGKTYLCTQYPVCV